MEFGGVMDVDGLVGSSCEGGGGEGNVGGGSNTMLFSSALVSSDTTDSTRPKGLFGSAASLKQGRTGVTEEQQDWRCLKMARTEALLMPTEKGHSSSFLRSNTHSLFPEGQHMLSFSSPKQDSLVVCHDGNLPYHLPSTSSMSSASAAYARNAGLGCGGLNMNMHGVLSGIRGPFTPSQWVELEHQAMIYKYIDANALIPPSLLISIRESQNLSGYSGYSAGSLTPSTIGWGSFQLGFSGSSDPEPGRCRRTDGKKWRCSRDAVADQKYCERHMNRGRHRSRKPVEGHPGHAKAMPIIAPSSAASAASVGGSPNDLTIAHQQVKSLQPGSTAPSPTQFNRILMDKENANNQVHDAHSLSMSISINSTTKGTVPVPPISKQYNPFEHSSRQADFGPSSSNYFLNRSISSYMENRNTASTPELSNQESQPQLLRHFTENWPKNQCDRSTLAWPELEQFHSDRTQLSISIPMASSDFSSSSAQEKITLSPLKSSRELDPIHMGLGVGRIVDNISHRQGSWAPISWGTSMGGPLGEVLNNTNNNPKDCFMNNSSALNLIDHWDSSPRLDSSPTGVLQKTAFGSHSSSTGSSPRGENHKNQETTGNLCDDLLGSTLVNATSM